MAAKTNIATPNAPLSTTAAIAIAEADAKIAEMIKEHEPAFDIFDILISDSSGELEDADRKKVGAVVASYNPKNWKKTKGYNVL